MTLERTTIIDSNGSKWAGESPDPIEKLYQVLETEPLEPDFERFGNFIFWDKVEGRTALRFHGNFFTVSHVFNVYTDDPEVIQKLSHLIRENQAGPAYREAKRQRQQQAEQRSTEALKPRRHWSYTQ